ncbi:MAG: SDR family oxidoreductase, partial [Propionicimonas sp.]
MTRPLALVTGGSRGIGRAVAEILSPTHHILVGGRDAARVAEAVAALPSAEPFVADLTDETALAAATSGIGQLDVLVHSAGRVAFGPVADSSTAEWRDLLDLNVVAPATLTRLLLPALRSAGGLVVFLNSGAGLSASPGFSAYAASKFALTALADALRGEERGRVRVTSVHP